MKKDLKKKKDWTKSKLHEDRFKEIFKLDDNQFLNINPRLKRDMIQVSQRNDKAIVRDVDIKNKVVKWEILLKSVEFLGFTIMDKGLRKDGPLVQKPKRQEMTTDEFQ